MARHYKRQALFAPYLKKIINNYFLKEKYRGRYRERKDE